MLSFCLHLQSGHYINIQVVCCGGIGIPVQVGWRSVANSNIVKSGHPVAGKHMLGYLIFFRFVYISIIQAESLFHGLFTLIFFSICRTQGFYSHHRLVLYLFVCLFKPCLL